MGKWGQQWGQHAWGGDGELAQPWEQGGTHHAAKEDTVYLGLSDTSTDAELATDISQFETNLTIGGGGGYFYEDGSDRWDVLTSRCIEVHVTLTVDENGTLWRHRNHSLFVQANALDVHHNGAAIITGLALPGLAATPREFLISWTTEANPLATDASDALRSEVHALNVDTGEHVQATVTHTEFDHSFNFACVWFAHTGGGATPHQGDVLGFRFSERFHVFDETYLDFIDGGSNQTFEAKTNRESSVMLDVASEAGDAGEIVGPVFSTVAADCRKNDLILVGPTYQWILQDTVRIRGSLEGLEPMLLPAPGSGDYQLLGFTGAYRPFPLAANRVKVRAHLGINADAAPPTLGIRLYSMNRPPGVQQGFVQKGMVPPPLEYFFAETSLTADHGDEDWAGEWVDVGTCPVVRDAIGRTWLFMAFDGGAGHDDLITINALSVEPVTVIGGGGLAGGNFGI